MISDVFVVSDRTSAESLWRRAFEPMGITPSCHAPERAAALAGQERALIIDAASQVFDEDELLSAVAYARSMGTVTAVHLPASSRFSAVEDLVEEICRGLVARSDQDLPRIAAGIVRRLDPQRSKRFEFVSVSPNKGGILVVFADGKVAHLERPLDESDDESAIDAIVLSDDAMSSTLHLQSGVTLELSAKYVQRSESGEFRASDLPQIAVNGAQLGAQLRRLRLEAGLTQAELARRTGIHRPNIARVEAGRHTPSLETLARIAAAIGVPTTRVLQPD